MPAAMKHNLVLTLSSLLSVVFFSLHVADDIARGFEPGNLSNWGIFPILAVWLYATLILAERRAGYVIILLASLMGSGVPFLHMKGAGLGRAIAGSDGGLLFVWTLLALGATSIVSVILALRGWWSLRRASVSS